MGKTTDFTGQRFGRLIVLKRVENSQGNKSRARYLCLCDCGNELIVLGSSLITGHTQSCGCLREERRIKAITKHGHARRNKTTSTFNCWRDMMQRCYNPNYKQYKDYGGRGIKVYIPWHKFENFLKDMGECPEGLTLERIDNEGHYWPGNNKWDTRKNQARNKRTTVLITFNDKTLCAKDWAKFLEIPYDFILYRLKKGIEFPEIYRQAREYVVGKHWDEDLQEVA